MVGNQFNSDFPSASYQAILGSAGLCPGQLWPLRGESQLDSYLPTHNCFPNTVLRTIVSLPIPGAKDTCHLLREGLCHSAGTGPELAGMGGGVPDHPSKHPAVWGLSQGSW